MSKASVLSHSRDGPTPRDKYQDELQQCGLSESLAEVHMDREFEGIRQMKDPCYWALDTLYHRLLFHREEPADAGGKRSGRGKPEFPKGKAAAETPQPSINAKKGVPTKDPGQQEVSGQTSSSPCPPTDTEVVWIKGGVLSQLSASYNAETRRINHLGILRIPPTDSVGTRDICTIQTPKTARSSM